MAAAAARPSSRSPSPSRPPGIAPVPGRRSSDATRGAQIESEARARHRHKDPLERVLERAGVDIAVENERKINELERQIRDLANRVRVLEELGPSGR